MKNFLVLFFSVCVTGSLLADEQTRAIQERLREQGFYYGEVDGHGGDETSAAIRRYQIRHGLRVTGQVNDETLRSLGMTREGERQYAPDRQEDRQYTDRRPDYPYYGNPYYGNRPAIPYPEPQERYDYQDVQPRYRMPQVAASYPALFSGTAYERAPEQIQENVLFAVQGELMRKGFYRGEIDGRPGPATTDAILRFQQDAEIPITGRLDNETLHELRALPGQRNGPAAEPFGRFPENERIYRGVPVQ
jgi:peptidoglycan hydrolase-like protein with peptidoglycan-binding domain